VEYTYIDLVEQPEQYEEVTRRNGGAKSIPVIVFNDGTHLTEPSNDQLREKLDR
jgi:mycoredoxin